MPKLSINKAGTWYTAKKLSVKIGGAWVQVKKMWINKGGTWQLITFLAPTGNDYSSSISGSENVISFKSDGDTWESSASGAGWLDSIGTGNGAGFWIRFSNYAGSAYLSGGRSFGTWYQMTSNIDVSISSFGDFEYAAGEYDVSDDAGATTLIVGNWEMYLNE
jgi:hypothetical protein